MRTKQDGIYSAAVGRILRRERRARGLEQADLAAVLTIQQPAYSRIETGATYVTVMQLRRLARRLGVTLASILDEAERIAPLVEIAADADAAVCASLTKRPAAAKRALPSGSHRA